MQLSRVRCYQGVPLFGTTLTYFDVSRREFQGWDFQYLEPRGLVQITDPSGIKTYIPTANISFFTELQLDGSENKTASERISAARKSAPRTT